MKFLKLQRDYESCIILPKCFLQTWATYWHLQTLLCFCLEKKIKKTNNNDRYKLIEGKTFFKIIYGKRQTPQISQLIWVLSESSLWTISHYSSLLDIVIHVTPYVTCLPFSSDSCFLQLRVIFHHPHSFLPPPRIQDEVENLLITALLSIVEEKGHLWELIQGD